MIKYPPHDGKRKLERRIFLLLLAVGDSGISGAPSLLIKLKAEETNNKTNQLQGHSLEWKSWPIFLKYHSDKIKIHLSVNVRSPTVTQFRPKVGPSTCGEDEKRKIYHCITFRWVKHLTFDKIILCLWVFTEWNSCCWVQSHSSYWGSGVIIKPRLFLAPSCACLWTDEHSSSSETHLKSSQYCCYHVTVLCHQTFQSSSLS